MNILFFTDNFPPEVNASATRVYERGLYWVRGGHSLTVITCFPNFPQGKIYPGYKNKWYAVEMMDGIRVVRVKTFISRNEGIVLRTLDFLSFMVTGSVAAMFQKRPDVIVATSPQFFCAVAGWMVALLRRLPFVFELGDLWPASITAVGAMRHNFLLRWMESMELFLYRQSAAIVALTNSFKSDLTGRGIDGKKISVVLNGVDLSKYAPKPKDSDLQRELNIGNCFVIGYIGTHGMAHALNSVLDTADILRDEPEIKFLFVGDGAAKQGLLEEATRRKLTNVIFVPPVPKERISAYWSVCDVALVHLKNTPVFSTVIPSKIFEAMGMGLPILLCSPEGDASRIVVEESAGVHIISEDPHIFADAVRGLKNDTARYDHFKQQSRISAQRHTRETQATEMMAVLESLHPRH